MSHDFAKKGKTTKKRKKKAQPQTKTWKSFGAGLLIGLVTGPLLYLAIISEKNSAASVQQSTAAEPIEQNKKPEQTDTTSLDKLKNQITYEFYDLLPKQETRIAVEQEPLRDSKKTDKRYMLQAGSFRKLSDADGLRAELIMKGLSNTKINPVTRSGSTWHRVQIGPYDSKRQMNQARNVLSRNGIDSLVLSMKK